MFDLEISDLMILEIKSNCGRVMPLIEDDEYDFIPKALERWADRRFTKETGFGPIWRD